MCSKVMYTVIRSCFPYLLSSWSVQIRWLIIYMAMTHIVVSMAMLVKTADKYNDNKSNDAHN